MARRYYLDASAYLAVLLGEAGSAEIEREVASSQVCSSTLLVLEASRNLIRPTRQGLLEPGKLTACLARIESDLANLSLRDHSLDLCRAVAMPVVSTPRTLDLVHLQTALWFHREAPLTRFISLDQAQNQAARELGLPVVA